MRRVWELYDGDYDEIQAQIRDRLSGHPHFGPLLRDLPQDDEQDAANRAHLRDAMIDWAWDGYWDNTRMQAAGYATAEIPLASWVELVNLFRHHAANQLIGSVTSARMMGAETIISGLSAEIAQTLVTVGIDLSLVVSAGDLQGGIELAEQHIG